MPSFKSRLAARKGPQTAKPASGGNTLANLQRELAEARTKQAQHESINSSLRAKADQAQAQLVTEKISRALHSAAAQAGAIDPDDVVELTRSKGARIEGDKVVFGVGDDMVEASAYVAKMLEAKPHLRRATAVAQGSGQSARQVTNGVPAVAVARPDPSNPSAVSDYYAKQVTAITEAAVAKMGTRKG